MFLPRRYYQPIAAMSGIGAAAQLAALLADGNTVADWHSDLGVTGTLNASAIANQIGAAGPLLQATGANQPIYLSYSGQKYVANFAVNGNGLNSPHAAVSTLTGDMSAVVSVALNSVAPAATTVLGINQAFSGGQFNWDFFVQAGATGKLVFVYSVDGTAQVTKVSSVSLASVGLADGQLIYLGVMHDADNDAGGNDVRFFWSLDKITWAQLGTTQTTAGAVTRKDSTQGLTAWADLVGLNDALNGKGYRSELYSGLYAGFTTPGAGSGSAVLVADCNATDWNETSTNNATQASSTTGEVWTLRNTAIATPAVIIGSPFIITNGVAHFMQAAYAANQPRSIDLVVMQPMWTIGKYVMDGTTANTLGLAKTTATPRLSVNAGAAAAENAGATLRVKHVVQIILNGASSSIRVDGGVATTGDAGAGNPGGITIGADGAGLNFGSMWFQEIIDRAVADTAAAQNARYALLKAIWGTA